jgi:hypothetical protein
VQGMRIFRGRASATGLSGAGFKEEERCNLSAGATSEKGILTSNKKVSCMCRVCGYLGGGQVLPVCQVLVLRKKKGATCLLVRQVRRGF